MKTITINQTTIEKTSPKRQVPVCTGLFYANLTKAGVIGEEGPSIEKIPT